MPESTAWVSTTRKTNPGSKTSPLYCSSVLPWPAAFFFFFFIGKALDAWFGTKGVFITIFTLLGIAGGANVVYRQILEVTKPKGEPGDEDRNDRN